VISPERAGWNLAGGLAVSFLVAVGVVWAGGRFQSAGDTGASLSWRWPPALASAVVFLVLYFIAGSLIYPWFREFYASRPVPPLPALLTLQFFRGLIWAAIAFPCLRRIESRRQAIAVLAVTFAVLGAVAPLLLPSEDMPVRIRLAHMVEMTGSHVLFGGFTGWVFTRRRA